MAKETKKKEQAAVQVIEAGPVFFNKLSDSKPEEKLIKDQIRKQLSAGKVCLRGPNQQVIFL